ncbi:phosphoribosylanthranilate isomerase [Helicobacter sp. MIT 99-5507]|uniref:phosphoribosylanthranilate isomerase n=1 Tax=Helicobacter sp. MIT 99-5507 TaxID=152489 RepID=UPI0015F16424|nr:phosphoribosylanthranilate isomerase [Helicobacter sp. MIT 99-5507]
MKIKTCGLFRLEDIEYANILKSDFIGFVFAKSKREVDFTIAKKLKSHLDSQIQAVGVFVNAPINKILEAIDLRIIDIVQLHGNESIEFISNLKSKTNAKIIYAIGINNENSIDYTKCDLVDFLLFDNIKGGSGESFDWNLLSKIKLPNKPYFLAGGININNIQKAIALHPYGIDVSGGLESNGYKDFYKMKTIITQVRQNKGV